MKAINKLNCIFLLALMGTPLFAITGREVAEAVENRPSGDSSHSLVAMDLIDKNGKVNSRTIEEYSREDDQDLKSLVMVFHAPASVKNTRFLVVERGENKDDDKWIYLPAMKRVRRIASSEGSSSFMGTDFTYDDMSSRNIDDYEYKLLKEENYNGHDCYVVEATPLKDDDQYSKLVSWVQKDILVNRKVDMYDKKGALLKTLTVEKVQPVQGFQTPIVTLMSNVQTKHSTKMTVKKFVYNGNFPPSLFSTRYLSTGKP